MGIQSSKMAKRVQWASQFSDQHDAQECHNRSAPSTDAVETPTLSSNTCHATQSSSARSKECIFLNRVPFEIREMIYKHLLLTQRKEIWYPVAGAPVFHPWSELSPSISRTCRQIYDECLPLLYRKNHFRFQDSKEVLSFMRSGLTWRMSKFIA